MELVLYNGSGKVHCTYFIPDDAVTPSFVEEIIQETLPVYDTEEEYKARRADLQRYKDQRR